MNGPRISSTTAGAMIVLAVIIDVLQLGVSALVLIPFIGFVLAMLLGPFISFIAAVIFGIWFSSCGLSLLQERRTLGFLGTILGEIVPFLGAIPWWTFFISFTVISERLKSGKAA